MSILICVLNELRFFFACSLVSEVLIRLFMCINFSVLILQSTSVYNVFAVKCENIQTFRWFVLENFRTALCDKECKVLSIDGCHCYYGSITIRLASIQLGQYRSQYSVKGKKGYSRYYSSSWEPHLRATGRHLPYGITQCYLSPDTSERTRLNPSHAGRYSIYLPRRDGRLS